MMYGRARCIWLLPGCLWAVAAHAQSADPATPGQLLRDPLLLPGLLAIGLALLLYLLLWFLVGRDPAAGAIVPRAQPPAGLSAAGARFLRLESYDHTTFAVVLVELAVQGLIHLGEHGDTFRISRLDDHTTGNLAEQMDALCGPNGRCLLAPEGRQVAEVLLGRRSQLTLADPPLVNQAIARLRARLQARYAGVYFLRNGSYLLLGIACSLLLVLQLAWRDVGHLGMLGFWRVFAGLAIIGLVIPGMPAALRSLWRDVVHGQLDQLEMGCGALFSTVMMAGMCVLSVALLWPAPRLLLAILAGIILLNLIFAHLLRAPTVKGRRTLDELEGFRRFLTGEASPPDAPALTPALFERYLPYALALDVGGAWLARCAPTLAQPQGRGLPYTPGWFTGPSWNRRQAPGLLDALEHALPDTIAHVAQGYNTGNPHTSLDRRNVGENRYRDDD